MKNVYEHWVGALTRLVPQNSEDLLGCLQALDPVSNLRFDIRCKEEP